MSDLLSKQGSSKVQVLITDPNCGHLTTTRVITIAEISRSSNETAKNTRGKQAIEIKEQRVDDMCERCFGQVFNLSRKPTPNRKQPAGRATCSLCNRKEMDYSCEYCHKQFGRMEIVELHGMICHGAPPNFLCHMCGVSYMSEYVFNKHLQLHGSETQTQFTCSTCVVNFASRSNATRHFYRAHAKGHKRIFYDSE